MDPSPSLATRTRYIVPACNSMVRLDPLAAPQSPTLVLLHAVGSAQPWYHDLLELCRFGPVLGQWTTFSRYFNEVLAGEYVSSVAADEFHGDYLSERTTAQDEKPVSAVRTSAATES